MRLILIALTVVIATDLLYHAWVAFSTETTGAVRRSIYGGVFALLGVGVLIAGLAAASFHVKAVTFLIEIEEEMVKVEWPTWPTVWRTTLLVAALMTVLSLVTLGVDVMFRKIVDTLMRSV